MLGAGKNSFTACSPDPFAPLPNPLFLWHYLICINIFMCVHVQVLLLYHLFSQSSCLIGYPLVFNGTSFLGFHGYSAWLGRAAQPIGECRWAGGCEAVPPGPRRAPPPLPFLSASTRSPSGGVQNKNNPTLSSVHGVGAPANSSEPPLPREGHRTTPLLSLLLHSSTLNTSNDLLLFTHPLFKAIDHCH